MNFHLILSRTNEGRVRDKARGVRFGRKPRASPRLKDKERALVLRQLLQQRLRLRQIARIEPFSEPAVDRSKPFVSLPRLFLVAPRRCQAYCGFPALTTTSDNTSSNAATNGQWLHTRRHWFATKNPSWRSRTRSWTPHGTPPKEAPAHRVIHKKMRVRALWSRRARALGEWHRSCGICSWRGQ